MIKRESVTRWGRGLISFLSWVLGAGFFVGLIYLVVRLKFGIGLIFVAFLIPFILSSDRAQEVETSTEVDEYSGLKTFKKPIKVFSGIGLVLCVGLWAWVRFVGV